MSDLREQLQSSLGTAYALDRELGGGGMSRVFLADERALGRKVVVKVLPSEMAAQVSLERFKREILLAAKLQHPHIVPLLSAGESEGLPYFTMPFVEGESLRARLARHGELPVSEAMRILREIASALSYAHDRGIVHRDIKPDNVLLSGGSAMVTDFGVAKALSASSNAEHAGVTSLGVALGTPAYMSPEQASADPSVDHRADIYAFGVLAYEMLTGQPPFVGRTPSSLLAAQVTEMPETITKRRASIPAPLAMLVMRCLEKRAADRPQSAGEIVHALDDITTPSGGMQPTSAIPATRPGAPTPAQRSWRIALLAVAIIVAGAVFAVRGRTPASPSASDGSVKSLAVLPFANAGDTANAYFVEGMTEAINSALSRLPGERVVPHSSAAAFRGKTVAEAGAKLGVDAIVEGTVRREGNRIRVTAGLVNVKDGSQVWSNRYDADAKDVFAVQDSVANAIVEALRITLSTTTLASLSSHGTTNVEAHDLVLRGRYLADEYTEVSLRSAVRAFEQAIKLDSNYAAAWAGLADTYGRLADDWDAPKVTKNVRHNAADRALRLDPSVASAHSAVAGELYWSEWSFGAAEAEFQAALKLDSAEAQAGFSYPYLLMETGRIDSAVAVIARAVRLNPYSFTLSRYYGYVLAVSGRGDKALATCSRTTGSDSARSSNCRSLVNTALGNYREALSERRAGPSALTGAGHASEAMLLARTGDTAGARRELVLAVEISRHKYVREGPIAVAYLALGDKNKAMEWLNRLYESGGSSIAFLRGDPLLAELRSDPRFQALIKRRDATAR